MGICAVWSRKIKEPGVPQCPNDWWLVLWGCWPETPQTGREDMGRFVNLRDSSSDSSGGKQNHSGFYSPAKPARGPKMIIFALPTSFFVILQAALGRSAGGSEWFERELRAWPHHLLRLSYWGVMVHDFTEKMAVEAHVVVAVQWLNRRNWYLDCNNKLIRAYSCPTGLRRLPSVMSSMRVQVYAE